MPEISIIVPVYNVEKQLDKCVQSLLDQTFRDVEILLVDDGSTDQSGALCDAYARQDSRVRVIHKENGGPSDARNAGIAAAKGSYLGFIDSDDYVDPDMYEVLYTALVKENADLSACGMYQRYTDEVRVAEDTTGYYIVDAKEAIRMVLESKKISVNPVNKLYKRELFEHITFPVGKRSEDAHIMIRLLDQVQKAVITMAPKYYYCHRAGSITTQPYSPADLSVIEAYTENLAFIKARYPELISAAEFRYYWAYFYVLDKMMFPESQDDPRERKRIARVLRGNRKTILRNPYFGRSRKISLLCLSVHVGLYKLCITAYNKRKRHLFA